MTKPNPPKFAAKDISRHEAGRPQPSAIAQTHEARPAADIGSIRHEISSLANPQSLQDRVKQRIVRHMKMPMAMLKGIRAKKIKDYKQVKEQEKTEGLLTANHNKQIDVDFYLKKQKKEKFKHLNSDEMSYKFKGVNSRPKHFTKYGSIGGKLKSKTHSAPNDRRNSSSVMTFSKKEIDSINKRK